ncbi:MAG: PAS domain S-box protein [Campylobacterota bacterium]|nr:PAS domain S-box protein [Campylobacterota bacterium]
MKVILLALFFTVSLFANQVDANRDNSLAWQITFLLTVSLLIVWFAYYKQKKLHALLEKQKELYDLVFENSSNAVLIFDIEKGRFIECNHQAVAMFKAQSKEEILNTHPSELSPEFQPDRSRSDEAIKNHIAEVLKKGAYNLEWKHMTMDGEEFWVDVILTKISLDGRAMLHVLLKDIDEKKKIEQRLLETVENFEVLFDEGLQGIIVWDSEYRAIKVNKVAQEIYKATADEMIGRHILEFVKPECYQLARESIARQKADPYEITALRGDGTEFTGYVTGSAITYNGAKARVTIMIELTDIKNKERELQELNETLEQRVKAKTKEQDELLSLFDRGDSVLFKWNNDERWSTEYVSSSVSRLLGYDKEDFIDDKIAYASCIYKDDLEGVSSEVNEAGQSEYDHFKHQPYRLVTKEGDIKWVLDNTLIVRDDSGTIVNYVGYISDITDLKKSEELLQRQSRLVQMGEMISMIAHQWRQPLNAISASAIKLNMQQDLGVLKPEDITEQSRFVQGQTQKMSKTINDFMNFFKPEKKIEHIDIRSLMDEVNSLMGAQLHSRGIELVYDQKESIEIECYKNELVHVLLNLITNARDAYDAGDKHPERLKQIVVGLESENETFKLSVQDQAGGIPEAIIDRVFDPYFTTKEQGNGTGIGLFMSRRIVEEALGGSISVENRDGGARFTVTLKQEGERDRV